MVLFFRWEPSSTRIIMIVHEFGGNGKCCDGRINISPGNVSFAQKYVCSEIHKVVDDEIFSVIEFKLDHMFDHVITCP